VTFIGRMIPVCVFAKPPVSGIVKTRLGSALRNDCAARLAEAMFADVWTTISACTGIRPILATTEFRDFPVKIPPSDIWLQGDGDLGARLERIITRGLLESPVVIAVGADSPILTSSHLIHALHNLNTTEAVIGPCADGGFYMLGLRGCPAGLLSDLPWSSSTTCEAVTQRFHDRGFTVAQIETLFDIDVFDDLHRLRDYFVRNPQVAPATRAWYFENQEDQLGALGLVVNVIILWNTLYMSAALEQLQAEGYPIQSEDVARLSPLVFDHINLLGRYAFSVPDSVVRGELRPLRKPEDALEDVA